MKKLLVFATSFLVSTAAFAGLIGETVKGTTDYSVELKIIDSTDGTPETGVVFNTSGIDLWYRRQGAASTDITEADLATPALTDAHADGGFLHINDGIYRLDLPDAAVASGADYVYVGGTVTGMIVIGGRVQLTGVDMNDGVRAGLTSLPNAAADAAGGLPVSDAGGLDLDGVLSGNTPQTGDSFARLGAPAGASVSADIAALPTTAEVNTEVDTALADIGLDHLISSALPTGWGTDVASGSVFDNVADDGTAAFDRTTDSLQAIADGGGGGPTAAQIVDEWETQSQADPTGFHVNVMEVNGTAQGATDIDARLDGIEGATFSSATDSLEAIRDRGDAAWTTGSGTGLSPIATGTAQSATGTTLVLASGETFADDELIGAVVQITGGTAGVGQSRCISDNVGSTDTITVATWTTTPTGTITYEIAPSLGGECPLSTSSSGATELNLTASGNIGIDWANVENATSTVGLTNTTVGTVTTNTDMRGTDSAATASALATAQTDLDTLTGSDGATLATSQPNYAPATAASLATAQTDLDTITGSDGVTLATTQGNYAPATSSALSTHDGKLDTVDANVDILRRAVAQQDTTIATLASQVSFTLTAGSADDDAYNGCGIMITDQSTATQIAMAGIQDYTGSSRTVTLDADPGIFTMAVGDLVTITCQAVSTEFMNKSEILGDGTSGTPWTGN